MVAKQDLGVDVFRAPLGAVLDMRTQRKHGLNARERRPVREVRAKCLSVVLSLREK